MNSPFRQEPLPRRVFLGGCFASLAFVAGGCAKVPSAGDSGTTARKLLRVRFSVRGQIATVNPTTGRQNYYFIVVNLTDDAAAPGPVPQLSPPYSNGIAVARQPDTVGMVGFIQYGGGLNDVHLFRAPRDITQTTLAYKRAQDTFYSEYQDRGLADSAAVSAQTIDVQFDLNRFLLDKLQTTDPSPTLPPYVQINIITTDNVPSGSANDQPKYWDALGDGRVIQNTYAQLSTVQSGQSLTSADGRDTDEPTDNDVRDRTLGGTVNADSLDITDWLIQVR